MSRACGARGSRSCRTPFTIVQKLNRLHGRGRTVYDQQTRERALELIEQGYSPREVSKKMGGRPGHMIIRKWAQGYVPQGKRRTARLYTAKEKVAAVQRVMAGERYADVAEELGCAPTTLVNWRTTYETDGEHALRTRVDDLL